MHIKYTKDKNIKCFFECNFTYIQDNIFTCLIRVKLKLPSQSQRIFNLWNQLHDETL